MSNLQKTNKKNISLHRKNNPRGAFLLFITALIWGLAFVAQSSAMDHIGPLLFVCVRFFLGGLILIPITIYMGNIRIKNGLITPSARKKEILDSIKPGVLCGLFLCLATVFQQYGIMTTTAGKSAFITALYIVFVPVAEFFLGKRINKVMIFSVIAAIFGFWLLCVKDDLEVAFGDILTVFCAVFFTLQIVLIDHYMEQDLDPIVTSMVQFFTVSILCFVPMLIFEGLRIDLIFAASYSILYTGIFSVGVAYTLQMVGQKMTDPTLSTLIMSLESVFATLAGALILHEMMTPREIIGCAIVLFSVIISQLAPSLTARSQ